MDSLCILDALNHFPVSSPGEIIRYTSVFLQAEAFRAQGDADGVHCGGGVRPLLAAFLHFQRHLRHQLHNAHLSSEDFVRLRGGAGLRQQLRQPHPVRLPVRQLQEELSECSVPEEGGGPGRDRAQRQPGGPEPDG